MSVCLSVSMFSATMRNETTKDRDLKVQCYIHWIDFDIGDFVKKYTAFERYGVESK